MCFNLIESIHFNNLFQLQKYGYGNIDAVEPSQEMIAKAEKHKVYRRTIVDFVGANRLDIDEGILAFDIFWIHVKIESKKKTFWPLHTTFQYIYTQL